MTAGSELLRKRGPRSVSAAEVGAWRGLARRSITSWRVAGAARPPLYWLVVATVAVLNLIGLVMILSASSVASLSNYGSAWFFFERQFIWTLLGIGAFIVASRVDYQHWRRWARPLLVLSVVLMVLVLVPGLGVNVDGSTRWLGRGQFRFQPTDIAKLALLIYTADLVVRRKDEITDLRRVFVPVLVVFAGLAALMMLQPDMDSTVILALIVGTVLFVGGIRMRVITLLSLGGLAIGALLAVAAPYRRARVFAYLNPWQDASNTGYQIAQSLIAIGSGGWTGVGLGEGRSKWLFLPNPHTDFIFAVIGEELGLLGAFSVVALFVAFAAFGTIAARRAPDLFGALVAAAITVWIVVQAIVNIGSVIGLLPVSGIPLPFVSFGGASLIVTMAAAGILANIAALGFEVTAGSHAGTPVYACITGGGTGGHVYPAIAIADALVAAGHARDSIRFIGARRGMEAGAVPAAGYDIDLLPGRGLQRSWRAVGTNLRSLYDTFRAFASAFALLGRLAPRVVVGVGGYASVPTVLAARLRRIPVVVHEQNAAPGLANRIAVGLGAKAAVSLPHTPLRRATLTGNPLRPAVLAAAWAPDREPRSVAVVGGSLGAQRLNDAALGVYDLWRDRHDVAVQHVAGRRNHEACAATLAKLRRPGDHLRYTLVPYEDDMGRLYARASVMVARAGAVTVAELAAVGVPSILVPLPGAPGDHQTANAHALVDVGAARLVPDAECDAARLAAELEALLDASPPVFDTMHAAARRVGNPDAAAAVVALVEASAR